MLRADYIDAWCIPDARALADMRVTHSTGRMGLSEEFLIGVGTLTTEGVGGDKGVASPSHVKTF